MRFVSTAGAAPPAPLEQALWASLAPDGGLYVPERLEPFAAHQVDELLGGGFGAGAALVLQRLFGDALSLPQLEGLVADALDFPLPLRDLQPRIAVLELFHGPTLAFKDVGARFMARLLDSLRSPETSRQEATVLVATSGDTGSAVAHAFLDRAGFRVVVLFPLGRVSASQQRQFTTLGGNVQAVAVRGAFDDCQHLVQRAFADRQLSQEVRLISANSISIARLFPQTLYYFEMLRQRRQQGRTGPLWVAVPCGNMGNLTAGLYAQRLGLPIERFVVASNANDVVPEFLRGSLFAPRDSLETLSNAMDVGNPSNFRRMRHLFGDDEALRRALVGFSFSDRETQAAIGEVEAATGVVLDPHSAIGYLGIRAALERSPHDVEGVFLATAHAAKFAEAVEPILGRQLTLPPQLAEAWLRDEQIVEIDASSEQLAALLRCADGAP